MTNKLYEIEILSNKKAAFLTIFTFDGLNKEMIFDDMINQKITSGVIIKNVNRLFDENICGEKILIAKGRDPLDATPEEIEFLIDITIRPKEIGLKVDFYDLNYIKDVSKGTPIFRVKPAKATRPGALIDGSLVLSLNGYKNLPSTNFYNIEFVQDENGWQIGCAAIDGSVRVSDNEIAVVTKVAINHNLDLKVGNLISKYSAIEINGDVKDGFKIESPSQVKISGILENSTVTTDKLIVDDRIITGKSQIKVSTLTTTNIIGRKSVYTKELFVANELRNCEVGVLDSAKVAKLSESNIFIKNRLEADIIGSTTSRPTTIYLGVDKHIHDENINIQKDIDELKVKAKLLTIERVKNQNELDELLILKRKNDFSLIYDSVIKYLEEEISYLDKTLRENEESVKTMLAEHLKNNSENNNPLAEIVVKEKIYQRTIINFGSLAQIELDKNYKSCRIYLNSESEIVVEESTN